MTAVRRAVRVAALVGTLFIGILALALIASQTPWFKDWARRYAVSRANELLAGELSIGRLRGNLFFGTTLEDVQITLDGEPVVSMDEVVLDYSVFDLVSDRILLDRVHVSNPTIRLERTAEGWNLARLVEEREPDGGPGRPFRIDELQVQNGTVLIEDEPAGTPNLPERLENLRLDMSLETGQGRQSYEIDELTFRARSPDLSLDRLSGTIVRDGDDLRFEDLVVRTNRSGWEMGGALSGGEEETVLDLRVSSSRTSFPELAPFVPALEGIELSPSFSVEAQGPLSALRTTFDLESAAGTAEGQVTLDVARPGRSAEGSVALERLDLGEWLQREAATSDISGNLRFDLAFGDTLDELQGRYAFEGTEVAVAGYQARDVSAQGRIEGRTVELDASADAYDASATAIGTVRLPGGGEPLRLDLQGRAAGVDLRRLPQALDVPRLDTTLTVRYELHGTPEALQASADFERSTIEGATIGAGATARVATGGPAVAYAFEGPVRDLDLARVGRVLEIEALAAERYESSVSGTFDLEGRGTDLQTLEIQAAGSLVDTSIFGASIPELSFDVALDEADLTGSAQGRFSGLNPEVLTDNEDLDGQVAGRLDVRFELRDLGTPITPEDVEVSGSVWLADSAVGGVEISEAQIRGGYTDQVASFEALQVAGPELQLTAQGTLALDREHTSDLAYQLDVDDLAAVGELLDQPLTGRIRTEGRATGALSDLTAAGSFNAEGLTYGDDLSATELEGKYRVRAPELNAEALEAEVQATGNLVEVAGQDLQALTVDASYANRDLRFQTDFAAGERDVQASGRVELHPDHREVHIERLSATAGGVTWEAAGAPAVQLQNDRLVIEDVALVSGSQRIEASGTLGLEAGRPGELDVRLQNVDLAPLDALLALDRNLAGTLDASATLTGSVQDLRASGEATIVGGRVDQYLFDRFTAGFEYGDEVARVDARLDQGPGQFLTVEGTVPLAALRTEDAGSAAGPGFDLRVESSEIGLAALGSVLPQVTEVQGTLQANLQVRGTRQDPQLDGFVDIRNGTFTVPATGVTYTGLDTRVTLEAGRALIQQFRVLDEEGNPLTISGAVAVDRTRVGDLNVSVTADQFEILDNDLGDVGVSVGLDVTGTLTRPLVRGNVRLNSGRVQVDRLLALVERDPYALKPGELGPPVPEELRAALEEERATPTFQALGFEISLVIPNNLVLRGDDLRFTGGAPIGLGDVNVTVGGDLQVRKPRGAEDIRIAGTVNTVRGVYEFQGRRFDIQRAGLIRFQGDEQINPLLDVTAQRVISGVEARVHIGGTMRDPELTLSSSPPLDQADILSLIVFNAPINQLGQGERVSLAQRAGSLAAGFVVSPLVESVGEALEIDQLELQAPTGGTGPVLTVGQQLSEDLYVKFRQQFGAEDVSELILEYQIAEFLRLQSSIAEGSGVGARSLTRRVERAGVDLIFFFSY